MNKTAIQTKNAPVPTGPFNQAIKVGNFIFILGILSVFYWKIRDQARRCIGNLQAILEEAGSSLDDVVKATVYLRHAEDANAFNEEYRNFFSPPLPARSSAIVGLKNPDMLVEMEVIAIVNE